MLVSRKSHDWFACLTTTTTKYSRSHYWRTFTHSGSRSKELLAGECLVGKMHVVLSVLPRPGFRLDKQPHVEGTWNDDHLCIWFLIQ